MMIILVTLPVSMLAADDVSDDVWGCGASSLVDSEDARISAASRLVASRDPKSNLETKIYTK